ncbi:MAG: hypothetical protein KF760_35025 [Candidatus Eremiobacteraeota bacterium]|nr:hypothetical protein [Candidatus Eremiobacteraeota bacterium]MCW5872696.1 hypothetical protein [Candidatus Eremiobacteraeota bacterium]
MLTLDGVLESLQPLLEQFRTAAAETDRSGRLPLWHLRELGRAGLYRLAVPLERGGLAAAPELVWEVHESLAAACGSTHFVQAQHQGGLGFLLRGNPDLLQEAYLTGERLCGVAFAHLRRPQSPVTVETTADGWIFRGEAPWFSGWGLLDEVVLAGRDERGQDIYALVPLAQPSIEMRECPQLSAIQASATVSLRLHELVVPKAALVLTQTLEEMARRDFRSQLGYTALPLGLVREAATFVADERIRRCLEERGAELRQRALAWVDDPAEALEIRASANLLALQAAQAAVISCGGQANQLQHPANRLLRESSFYFLTQLNAPLRAVALEKLVPSSREQDWGRAFA